MDMKNKIKDLIDNIEIGNADAINASFSTVMAEKVSARLDSLKQEVKLIRSLIKWQSQRLYWKNQKMKL